MKRLRLPELMDDPGLDPALHAHALRALIRINRLLRVDHGLAAAVRRIAGREDPSILDLGVGGGGFLGYLHGRRTAGNSSLLVGLDISEFALGRAREWAGDCIHCVAGDVKAIPVSDDGIDVVTCSLLLHHFDEEDVVEILREAARVARQGVVIGDLSRSRLAWMVTWLGTHVTSRSPVFRIDGPRSVRAAYRLSELAELAGLAGLDGTRVWRRFPFRLMLAWRKPASRP